MPRSIILRFFTQNIDTKKYETAILEYLFSHVNRNDLGKAVEFNKWIIEIVPTTMSDQNFGDKPLNGSGTLNPSGIPHGITNPNVKKVTAYVNDKAGDMVLLQNFKTSIGHELAHMILSVYYHDLMLIPRHQDRSWSNPHSKAHYYTTEVHDREWEMSEYGLWKRFMKIYKYTILGKQVGTLLIPCLNLFDITDTRETNRDV